MTSPSSSGRCANTLCKIPINFEGPVCGTTALWDTTTQQATAHLSVAGSGKAVESLAFAPDASLLAVANQARGTYLWRITQLP